MDFSVINGTTGAYKSSAELIISGNSKAIAEVIQRLTIINLNAKRELAQLKKSVPRNQKHLDIMVARQAELLDAVETHCYAELDDGTLSVPPGCWFICEHITGHECSVKPVFYGTERYYQKEAIANLLKYNRACVSLVTGSGKTQILRALTASHVALGRRVCIAVPSVELVTQTFYAIQEGGKFTVTMLGGGKKPKDGCDVLVTTAQSALSEIEKYDVLICDELHRFGSESFNAVMAGALNATHVYGMTGTLVRADGLMGLVYSFCGKNVYTYTYEDGVRDQFLAPVKYLQKSIKVSVHPKPTMHMVKRYIAVHSDANYLNTVATMIQQSLAKGRATLVLFKTLEPARKLADMLGVEAASGEYRNPYYKFKKGELDLLIGTTSLLSTGLDVPRIASIIYCAGGNSEVTLKQSVGRGTRLSPGKTDCVIVDCIPQDYGEFEIQARARKNLMKEYI